MDILHFNYIQTYFKKFNPLHFCNFVLGQKKHQMDLNIYIQKTNFFVDSAFLSKKSVEKPWKSSIQNSAHKYTNHSNLM